ncbi:MAG: sterol desaturase family protein [Myxococcota bacterium]|jgi:sterol desaturase/sphingolipid hydroxylase (fatty acid hydroxylase superfamily)|nr:sterol desaturase family protein [Myxococcota bacterium]
MVYDWKAGIAFFITLVALTVIGRRVVFLVPAFQRMRELNHEVDKVKLKRARFKKAVKASSQIGLYTNLAFYLLVLPFAVNLEPRPLWRYPLDILAVLLFFDFFYYLVHRFLFHGKILRKVHSLHHQALKPTYMDALYVHPLETFIGLFLFLFSIPAVGILMGGPLNAFSMAIATLIFTQLNTINHTFVNLPYGPYKVVDYITSIHAAHHVDMNSGNYATLTMFYDWIFGTLEKPVGRPEA